MARRPRLAAGDLAYHVLNRRVGRLSLFDQPADYAAFETILAEAQTQTGIRIAAYCLMPSHWHLLLWPRRDGELSEVLRWMTVTHTQRWHAHHHTAGTGPVYQGRFKSLPVQTDAHFLTVARYVEAQCAAGEAGGAAGGLAMVEWMATDPRGSEADDLAQCVAGRAATRLGGAYESASDGIGVRGASRECATGPPVWRRRVGPPNGQTFWNGVDDTVPWATEGIMREDSCLSSLHIDVMRAPKRRVFSAPSRILAQNLRLSHCR